MNSVEERRSSRRAMNASFEQLREHKPNWLYTQRDDSALFTLIIDLSENGCSFMLPKDFQVTASDLTFSIHESDDALVSEFNLIFQTVWIDEHFSQNEQKIGVEFNNIQEEVLQQLKRCMDYLESDRASLLRCRVKVKEELAFF